MGKPYFLRLLFAFALAFSGSATQLHSLAHAQHDLASASGALDGKTPAPLKHSTDQCLVVHALDGTTAQSGARLSVENLSQYVFPVRVERSGAAPVLAFRSRAPPVLA